jgi:hypothetical protein
MKNTSEHDLLLSGAALSNSNFRGLLERLMDIQIRDSDGTPAPETERGKIIHRRAGPLAGGNGFLHDCKPGETFTEQSDLSAEFELTKPGTYTVQASRYDSVSGQVVKSNTLTLTVTE